VVSDCDAVDQRPMVVVGRDRGRGRSLSSHSPRSSSLSPVRGGRGRGRGRSVSPDFARATYAAVHSAMQRRQAQVMELRAELRSLRDEQHTLQCQLDETTTQRRRLDKSVTSLTDDKESL